MKKEKFVKTVSIIFALIIGVTVFVTIIKNSTLAESFKTVTDEEYAKLISYCDQAALTLNSNDFPKEYSTAYNLNVELGELQIAVSSAKAKVTARYKLKELLVKHESGKATYDVNLDLDYTEYVKSTKCSENGTVLVLLFIACALISMIIYYCAYDLLNKTIKSLKS